MARDDQISEKELFRHQLILDMTRISRHRIATDPVDNGDKEIKLEGTDFAVVDDLRGFGEVDVADD